MGIFSEIGRRVPRRFAIAAMNIAALFGTRTPPDPEVTAQVTPAQPRAARDDDPPEFEFRRGPQRPPRPQPKDDRNAPQI